MDLKLLAGLVILSLMVWAVLWEVDVRLALFAASFALGILAGDAAAVVKVFLSTLSSEKYVIPLCTAMGFARVLVHTGCDQHLVQLLVRPLRRVRWLLIPGAVLVGFLVNVPVISQTSTAVAVGTVLVPVLLAARVSPATTGAALLLGASLGGELLNPAAPELQSVARALQGSAADCVEKVIPLVFADLVVATAVFWILSARVEAAAPAEPAGAVEVVPTLEVNLFKAAVPLVPLVLLFLSFQRFGILTVPQHWLTDDNRAVFDTRLIGAAMLVGVVIAMLTNWRTANGSTKAFFEGAGYALANIVALIATAACFGEGVKKIGWMELISGFIAAQPLLLIVAAGALPLLFGMVSGSGMAATESLFVLYVAPSQALGIDPVHVGAVVSLGAAAGRTMSPVAAVTLMCATMTKTNPFTLSRRVALPLLAGIAAVVALAAWR